MTTKKFSQFDEATSLLDTDYVPVLRNTEPSPATRNKKVSITAFATSVATRISSPVSFPTTDTIQDGDAFSIAQSGSPKKVLFTTLFARIVAALTASKTINSTYAYNDGATLTTMTSTSFDVLVNGVSPGDFGSVSFSTTIPVGIMVFAQANVANNVKFTYLNSSGSTVILPTHTINIRIDRKTPI